MRIAIDTGGTFTDCVFLRGPRLEILKIPSTPRNPADAIGEALNSIFALLADADRHQLPSPPAPTFSGPALDLTCGTTVGTNALLERRGGRVALVTTAGFEDVLEIGRQARPRLYDFFVTRPAPLVRAALRFGLRERVAADGIAVARPGAAELRRVTRRVARCGAESAAVCLLFSYANPAHERAIARRLRACGIPVSVSHEVLPEFREFERTATTVINAYLAPVMSRYLEDVDRLARASVRRARRPRAAHPDALGARVRVMQSSGGIISARVAAREPVRTILSGPAGGVLGAQYVAELAGFPRLISFDMGGTSTDVALLEGGLRTTNESTLADLPVAVPMLDIHTVGAGGGSLARFDRAGALRVGPESAGADPGPICYGRGERPTVTDAHLALGRIPREGFLGGNFPLDEARTRSLLDRARRPMPSLEDFALGIVAVANATMEKAIRVISVERGHDPRDYTLVAFGGAGGLHACDLAAALDMPRVLVPRFPGALSALGILRADVVKDFSRTLRLEVASAAERRATLESEFRRLERQGFLDLRAEGFPPRLVRVERLLDARYVGQAYELTVSARGDFVAAFHRAHERRYGYADRARRVEVVTLRVRLSGPTPKPSLPRLKRGSASPRAAFLESRPAFFFRRWLPTAFFRRDALFAGNHLRGPAVVVEYSATTIVPPGWFARVDGYGNLLLERVRK